MLLEQAIKVIVPPTVPEGILAENWGEYRKTLISAFANEEYGVTPPPPSEVRASFMEDNHFYDDWCGKAKHTIVKLSFDTPNGEFGFRTDLTFPLSEKPVPVIVYIAFTPYPHGGFCPMEEVLDHGFGVASFYYEDVTADCDDHFESGIAALYPRNGKNAWGKIGMWAFAASRVMDYLLTLPQVNHEQIFVLGHSRLGKTALWCAAQDLRFCGVASNAAGCSGDAISRVKKGEHIADICSRFPFWFCENYQKYAGHENLLPFDQHQLLALIAPRPLCIGCASEDIWADPDSEYLSARLATSAYDLLSAPGLLAGDHPHIQPGDCFHEGNIGFHCRKGTHFLGRNDWQQYMSFFREKMQC